MSAADDLLQLILDASSTDDLQRKLLSPAEQELLKRLALVSVFDKALVDELSPPGAPSFLELIGRPFVEHVPGSAGTFRLGAAARSDYRKQWSEEDRAALVELSRTFVDRFEGSDPVAELRHRLVVDPSAALERFAVLYDEADHDFDLARCHDLLNVLDDQLEWVGPDLFTIKDSYRRYLDARGLWIDEFFRTQRFVLPEASRAPIEALLAGETRALDLHGPGGYGKTMHVRWLIARRCVPAPHRIPCARIDFDAIDVLAATREPHLLLLEAADQLNWQLPGRPFVELLRDHRKDRERLRRRDRAETVRGADAALEGEAEGDALGADVVARFLDGLSMQATEVPVILILDTLEEALLLADPASDEPAAAGLLRMLASVHASAGTLRIVFSGRYPVSTRMEALAARFEGLTAHELTRLEADEAREYLSECRGITRKSQLAAALTASGRVPFNLALIADVIAGEPDITAAKIRALPADQLYLIERVVMRLPDQPLRWLLRYGSIPRRLDLAFVRAVMVPHIELESAEGALDDPADASLPVDTDGRQPWERADGPVAIDAGELWRRLLRYAGDSSWVFPHPDDPEALLLQPEIVRPMRRLLSERRIVPRLNADAVAYFLARAASEPDDAGRWLREAVFHRFQLEGPAAGDWWVQQVELKSPGTRRELATELVFGHDYHDERGRLREWGTDGQILAPETLALAQLELAQSSLELAVARAVPLTHPLFHEAAQALAQLESSNGSALVSSVRLELVQLGVRLSREPIGSSGEHVNRVILGAIADARDTAWLQLLFARRLSDERMPGAREALEQALGGLTQVGPERDRVLRELIELHASSDDLETALMTLYAAEARGDLGHPADRLLLGHLHLRTGDFTRAEATTKSLYQPPLAFAAGVVTARAALESWRAVDAARVSGTEHELGAQLGDAPADVDADRADRARVAGAARARLLDVERAQDELARAEKLANRASAWSAVAWVHVVEAELMLRGLGHLRGAGVALDRAERVAPVHSEPWLRAGLLRADLASRLEDAEAGGAALARLQAAVERPRSSPSHHALLAVAGLAVAPAQHLARYATLLADALERIQPPAAGLLLLDGLARCDRKLPLEAALKLEPFAMRSWDMHLAELEQRDRGVLLVRVADLQRVCGRPAAAAETLGAARACLGADPGPPVAARELLRAAARLGDAGLIASLAAEAVGAALATADEYPLLAAATIVEAAEADPTTSPETVDRAPPFLAAAGSVGETWRARLNELLAAQPHRHDEAAAHLEAAATLYDAVGDARRAAAVRARLGATEAAPPEELALVVTLTLDDDGLHVEHLPPGGTQATPVAVPESTLVGEIMTWRAQATRQPFPAGLPDAIVRRNTIERELYALMGSPSAEHGIRLRVRDASLQLLPWELARGKSGMLSGAARVLYRAPWRRAPDGRTVRTVQAGLNRLDGSGLTVDGVAGPATMRALAVHDQARIDDPLTVQRLHRALLGDTRPGVVLAQPSRRASEKLMRRSAQSREQMERGYGASGYDPLLVDVDVDEPADVLLRVMSQDPPPVLLHATGGFVPTGGTVCLDFTGGWGSALEGPESVSTQITTTQLDRALRAAAPDWPAPVVVLEATTPSGARESAIQLLLRNAFAAELFALGGTRAVLATALASHDTQHRLNVRLSGELAQGQPLGDFYRRLRSGGDPALFSTAALWCEDPRIMLPPGL